MSFVRLEGCCVQLRVNHPRQVLRLGRRWTGNRREAVTRLFERPKASSYIYFFSFIFMNINSRLYMCLTVYNTQKHKYMSVCRCLCLCDE